MFVLAIDTATPTVVVGVARVDAASHVDVLAQRQVTTSRGHAEVLSTLIVQALASAGITRPQLAAVVVGIGPGPFTGLRVGMASAAAFADALDIDVFGVCTFDAIAIAAGSPSVLVVTDARRREVYWAHYRGAERSDGPHVGAATTVAESIANVDISGVAGSPEHCALFDLPIIDVTAPSVAGLVGAADLTELPQPLRPLYLRRPDAKPLPEFVRPDDRDEYSQ